MNKFEGSSKYIAGEELLNSVNVAMALQKPLLIKGEPGTGKTMLAEAIAESLGMELIIWSIKSTTKAQDGLYLYDTVQRLYDSQFGEGNVGDIKQYIRLGKLGEAFTSEKQCVLLIDEIDKADLEFPNDLLWELDKMEFYINETKETIKTKTRPIVIITSNAEKELVHAHYGDIDKKLVEQAMEAFYSLRDMNELQKKPSTSELLDWIQALIISGVDIKKIVDEIPYVGVLLKKNEDIEVMREIKEKGYSLKRW